MSINLDELRKIAESATSGPWHWSGNADNQQLYLATWIKGAGRCQVMDFERWGMQKAVPRFLDDDSLMMETAKDLMVYEVARNQNLPDDTPRNHPKVYRADVVDVRHPNARFMAAANPETVLALLSRLEQAEENLESALEANKRWAHRSSRERSELFKAEQAVARVREAIKDAPTSDPTRGFAGPPDDYPDIEHFIGNGEWSVAERVRRALDGDTRG